tara:strand:- start:11514 stop:11705 length:192 start_codon:yes stop_codon:yes gene_type:complete
MANRKNNGEFMKKRQMVNRSHFQVHKRRIQKEEKYDKYDKLQRSRMILQDRRNILIDNILIEV